MAQASEAEVLAGELLGAIGQDALDQTGGDRYRAGEPLLSDPSVDRPDAGSPPAPESVEVTEGEPQAPQETAPVQPAAETEWFLPGLYKTREDAVKGIHETKRYASEAQDKVRELTAPKAAPEAPAADPLDELAIYGVPKDIMQKAMTQMSRQAIQEILAPVARRQEADQAIISLYPEYETKFPELEAFVKSQPELLQKVERAEHAGEFLLARELAWLNFERMNAVKTTERLVENGNKRVAEAKGKMADASVTKPSQAESRTRAAFVSPNDIPEEKFGDLIEMAKAGYPSQLWRQTIGSTLERDYPAIFGPQQP